MTPARSTLANQEYPSASKELGQKLIREQFAPSASPDFLRSQKSPLTGYCVRFIRHIHWALTGDRRYRWDPTPDYLEQLYEAQAAYKPSCLFRVKAEQYTFASPTRRT